MSYTHENVLSLIFDVITNIIKFMEITNGAWQLSDSLFESLVLLLLFYIEKNGLFLSLLVSWFNLVAGVPYYMSVCVMCVRIHLCECQINGTNLLWWGD